MPYDTWIETGSYTGTAASKSITIGWQPALIWFYNEDQAVISLKHADHSGSTYNRTMPVGSGSSVTITSTGFDLGTEAQVNGSGDTIHWVAWPEFGFGHMINWDGDTDPATFLTKIAEYKRDLVFYADDKDGTLAYSSGDIVGQYGQYGDFNWGFVDVLRSNGADGMEMHQAFRVDGTSYSAYALELGWRNTIPDNSQCWWGTFVGDGNNGHLISFGVQPRFWQQTKDLGNPTAFKTDTMGANHWVKCRLKSSADLQTSGVTFGATGVTLSSDQDLNKNNTDYKFQMAWK